jgi:NADH-quinone oxidoreductase subunit M
VKLVGLTPLFLFAALTVGIARFAKEALPAYLVAGVAATIPRRHGWGVRAAIAVTAGLLTLFVVRAWPEAGETVDVAAEPTGLLSWLIGIPIAGAFAMLALPRGAPKLLQGATMAVMLGTLALAVPLLDVRMGRGFHCDQNLAWIPALGIRYHVALDGITLWMVLLTVFLLPVAALVSIASKGERLKDWCFALLLLEGALLGAFVSLDLFLFYVFWELMVIPMYVMIGVWGGQNRVRSALKLFVYTLAGSVLMLGAVVYLAHAYARVSPDHQPSFDYFELARLEIPQHLQIWLFAAFAIAFFIKAPMWPVHTWQPDAYSEAPAGGAIILAAVMSKVGAYGYLRFGMGMFPQAAASLAGTLSGVAVLGGIVYGALCAWKQRDMRRLLAYSSLSHVGYIMLGFFAATPSSLEGAILQMVSHGVVLALLFLLVDMLHDRRRTRFADELGGLARSMPVTATLFFIATLASVSLPGTSGFVGEIMVISGTYMSARLGHLGGIDAVGATIGVLLGAVFMFSLYQKVFLGPITRKENARVADIDGRELVAVTPLILMVFIIGLFPNIFLSRMRDAVLRVEGDYVSRIEAKAASPSAPDVIRLGSRSPDAPSLATTPSPSP